MFRLSRCGLLTADVAVDDAKSYDALLTLLRGHLMRIEMPIYLSEWLQVC